MLCRVAQVAYVACSTNEFTLLWLHPHILVEVLRLTRRVSTQLLSISHLGKFQIT